MWLMVDTASWLKLQYFQCRRSVHINKKIQTESKMPFVNIEVKHVIHGQHKGCKNKLPALVPECTRYNHVLQGRNRQRQESGKLSVSRS